jgi:hypothetical protein
MSAFKNKKNSFGYWITKTGIEASFWLKNKAEKEKAEAKKEWSEIWSAEKNKIKRLKNND